MQVYNRDIGVLPSGGKKWSWPNAPHPKTKSLVTSSHTVLDRLYCYTQPAMSSGRTLLLHTAFYEQWAPSTATHSLLWAVGALYCYTQPAMSSGRPLLLHTACYDQWLLSTATHSLLWAVGVLYCYTQPASALVGCEVVYSVWRVC